MMIPSARTTGRLRDIQPQANIEYRFPVAGFLKGAVYADIANIWLLDESVDLPGGKFYGSQFLSELGISVGLGIRIDVDFFVFRLDPAIPIKVPYYAEQNHWYFSKLRLSDIIWNFGIGYPF